MELGNKVTEEETEGEIGTGEEAGPLADEGWL